MPEINIIEFEMGFELLEAEEVGAGKDEVKEVESEDSEEEVEEEVEGDEEDEGDEVEEEIDEGGFSAEFRALLEQLEAAGIELEEETVIPVRADEGM